MQAGNPREAGFTYVAVLFAIAVFGIGLAAIGQATSAEAQREREAQLIREGLSVVSAIRSYYYASPGAARTLPKSWDDLLEDKRFVGIRRHLRRVPLDPFSSTTDWGEIRDPDGTLVGIYSKSDKTPFRTTPITFDRQTIAAATRYSDWKFRFMADQEIR